MNIRFSILMFLISVIAFSQETNTETDSINNTSNSYIEKHHQQLNISFEVGNERTNFFVPFENGKATVKSNLNLRYAFVFSYKFLSVRLGIRPSVSDTEEKNKGKSKIFRLRVKLLFDRWSHQLEYNRQEGYYIGNSGDFNSSTVDKDFHIQFPGLTTNIFQGSSLYKFNDNYSLRAVASQTEIQLKSVGSFMPSLDYMYYNLKGADEVKTNPNETIIRDIYSDVEGFNIILNAGYYYTFVYHKYWFANAFAISGFGLDIYNNTQYVSEQSTDINNTDVFFSLKSGISVGYNGKKIFAGAGYAYRYSTEKFNANDIQLQPTQDSFKIYLGYRFRAPKQVRKPVEKIEDMVPILKEEDGNN